MFDFKGFDAADMEAIAARQKWLDEARPNQIPPKGDWNLGIWLAGRFYGKTRTLVEYAWWEGVRVPGIRIHALAPTIGDVRRVLFEGESGFLSKVPEAVAPRSNYNRTLGEFTFNNGTVIQGFSVTEEADRMRGPQCHLMIFDEAAAADRPAGNLEAAYKVAALGCRLPWVDGTPARKLLATTPKPIPFLKNLIRRPGAVVVHGTSYENRKNVSASVFDEVAMAEGTSYGRQEIYGDFIDEEEGSIISRGWLRLWPNTKKLPTFTFILTSYDTALEEEHYDRKTNEMDYTACTVWGIFNVKQCFTPAEIKALGVKSQNAALLCDAWTERLGFPDLLEKARAVHRTQWGQGVNGGPGRKSDIILIENKVSGISLRQSLTAYGLPAWPFNPGRRSKTERIHAASPFFKQGCFFIPESSREDRKGMPRDWCEPLLEQLCAFKGPGSLQHEDFVDSVSQASDYFVARDMLTVAPVAMPDPDPEETRAKKEKEAQRLYDREKRMINPYSVAVPFLICLWSFAVSMVA